MSITIYEKDATLSRLLFLEARRQGFREEHDPRVILIDLDDFDLPKELSRDMLCIGLSKTPGDLPQSKKERISILLSLPFSVAELEEKLHRLRGNAKNSTLTITKERVTLNGVTVPLSKTERAVLDLLCQNRDRIVHEQEIAALLGEAADKTNAVAVYLYRLRRKLSSDGQSRIKTHRGIGYQWLSEAT